MWHARAFFGEIWPKFTAFETWAIYICLAEVVLLQPNLAGVLTPAFTRTHKHARRGDICPLYTDHH